MPSLWFFGRSSAHTYQSRNDDFGSRRACWNQGESMDVWLTTRSTMTRMPSGVGVLDEVDEVAERPVPLVHTVVVGDVVAVVAVG